MHKLDNICSSSVYGLCVSFAPERGLKPHAPAELVPKRAIFGYFSPMNALWRRQFDIDENETNCVNYKYCLVDAPGVSNSCID